jgi:undecaprenyl-diphosphatase
LPVPRVADRPTRFDVRSSTLLHAGLITAGLLVFLVLATLVADGHPLSFDVDLMLLLRDPADPLRPIGPEWLTGVWRDFTALGSIGVLSFITLTVSGFLLLQNKRRTAVFVLAAVASGMLLSSALKLGFDRARPDLVPHGATVYTPGFPSGHALLSAVAYLTLSALLARTQPRRRIRIFLVAIAVLLTVLIGATRILLGVHWPSDVAAGWAVGVVWASACWLVARQLQRHGRLENPGKEPPEGGL